MLYALKLKGRNHLGDLGIDGRIILKTHLIVIGCGGMNPNRTTTRQHYHRFHESLMLVSSGSRNYLPEVIHRLIGSVCTYLGVLSFTILYNAGV
jgi:hypothetical protein